MTEIQTQMNATIIPVDTSMSLWRRLIRRPLAIASLSVIAVALLVAVLAPLIAPYGGDDTDLARSLAVPSADHLLGADRAGRDLFSRLVLATPVSIGGMALTLMVALVIGLPAGVAAGYWGKKTALFANWGADLMMAMPAIIILLAIRAAFGASIWVSMAVFGLLLSPIVYRVVETTIRDSRSELYLHAARVNGLGSLAIIRRHLLGVLAAPLLIQSAFIAGIAIGMQAALEFIGIGDSSVPTWGGMLDLGFKEVYAHPLQMIWPMIAIAALSAALILLATTLTDLTRTHATTSTRRPNSGFNHLDRDPVAARDHVADALLEVQDLRVAYPIAGDARGQNIVVKGADLTVSHGEIVGLVGESGSGKTQVALSVLGLLPGNARIVSGEIQLEGAPLSTMTREGRRRLLQDKISYVPQEPMTNLDPSFTVGDQTGRTLRLFHGMNRAQARQRVLELFDQVGITDPERVFRSYPHEISGGMAQRVLIAGALVSDPVLLIADEPTTALDVTVQAEVLDVFRRLNQERNLAILLVTHNLGVVADLCHTMAVMNDGAIVERGDVRDVLRTPQHEYTRSLLSGVLSERNPRITTEELKETER